MLRITSSQVKLAGKKISIEQVRDNVLQAISYFLPEIKWDIWTERPYEAPGMGNKSYYSMLLGTQLAACDEVYDIEAFISWTFDKSLKVFDSEYGGHGITFYCDVRPSENHTADLDTPTEVGQFVANAIRDIRQKLPCLA
ncbi:MAG: hypothetical protein ACXAC5_03420 [Promethearchaeota archaeon]|jgi:hypothetical protein